MLAVAGQVAGVILGGPLEGVLRVLVELAGEVQAQVEQQLVMPAEFFRDGAVILGQRAAVFFGLKPRMSARDAALTCFGWDRRARPASSGTLAALAAALAASALVCSSTLAAAFAAARASSSEKAIGRAGALARLWARIPAAQAGARRNFLGGRGLGGRGGLWARASLWRAGRASGGRGGIGGFFGTGFTVLGWAGLALGAGDFLTGFLGVFLDMMFWGSGFSG